MSAEIFGANLLEEVQEHSLDELLNDLRYGLDPEPECYTGIEKLDSLLDIFLHPSRRHDGGTTEENTHGETINTTIYANNQPTIGEHGPKFPIIELGHSASGTGQSNLLYHLTAASILPKSYGGKEATVVWLDTNISFSATRLHQVCINYTTKTTTHPDKPPQAPPTEDEVHEALKHVHVFSISSSKQLIAVLNNLKSYLFQSHDGSDETVPTSHYSMHRPLSLIVLDSVTSFHWPDRWDSELQKLEAVKAPGVSGSVAQPTQSSIQTPLPTALQALTALQSLQSTFHCTVIYTTTTTTTTTNPPSNSRRHRSAPDPDRNLNPLPLPLPEDDNLIPTLSPWSTACTLSLTLTRLPVPQFASHMSLADCVRDRNKRQEIVRLGRVRVGICEDWFSAVVKRGERGREIGEILGAGGRGRGAFVVRVVNAREGGGGGGIIVE